MTHETWKDVTGWEGRYLISDQGRLSRLMKLSPHRGGYLKVNLAHDGKRETPNVHPLVAATFLGPRPDGHQVNHIDGNKVNNCVTNLEYSTPQRNSIHAFELNLRPIGESVNTAKLTADDVANIRKMYSAESRSYSTLAKIFGVHKGTIARVIQGKTWKHVGCTTPQQSNEEEQPREKWLPIVGWEPYYIVSNHGRVARLMDPGPAPDGHIKVSLSLVDFHQNVSLHRLVAQAFLDDYSEDFQVNHIDGNKANNYLSNLECLPITEIYRRTVERLGYSPGISGTKGEANNQSKLTADKVRCIRSLYATGQHSYQSIADRYGVTKQAIWHIVQRKTWDHVN